MTSTLHEYGVKSTSPPLKDEDRVGPTVDDAVRAGLNQLRIFPITTVIRFDTAHTRPLVAAKVDLYRIRLGSVLPIGVGDVAEQARSLLSNGFDGWSMPALPTNPKPLQTYEPSLPIKVTNLLSRAGFRIAEEVALVPDAVLLELRNMGTKQLTQLRQVIPHRPLPEDSVPEPNPNTSPNEAGWIGTNTLLHRMGQLTTTLAGLLAGEQDCDPATRRRVATDITALREELATFASTNLDPPSTGQQ